MARAGFHDRKTERCPDCEVEWRLDVLGHPIRRWITIRGKRHLLFSATHGCETCGGTGRVRLEDRRRRDPYDTRQGSHDLKSS